MLHACCNAQQSNNGNSQCKTSMHHTRVAQAIATVTTTHAKHDAPTQSFLRKFAFFLFAASIRSPVATQLERRKNEGGNNAQDDTKCCDVQLRPHPQRNTKIQRCTPSTVTHSPCAAHPQASHCWTSTTSTTRTTTMQQVRKLILNTMSNASTARS